MLDRLIEYALKEQLVAEPGFAPKEIRWALNFDGSGKFLGVLPLGDTSDRRNRGQLFPKCPDLSQPELTSGGGSRSHFLAETCEVIADWPKPGSPAKDVSRIRDKHAYFVKLLDAASGALPCLKAVASSLNNGQTLQQIRDALSSASIKARPTDKATIRVDGEFPLENPSWHAWWRSFRQSLGKGSSGGKMLSLATGQPVEPAPTHPKVQGLSDVGGEGRGSALIAYDKPAFRSYGLSQSENGAASKEEAAAYRAALYHLLTHHSRRLAGAKVVLWFRERVKDEEDPLGWLEGSRETDELAAQQRARELLDAIRDGKRPDLQQNYYYALTLSGAAGRVMVRDWMEGQFEELAANINGWFDDLSIVNPEGNGLAPPPRFSAALRALVRAEDDLPAPGRARRGAVRAEDDLPAPEVAALWHSALTRGRIPRQMVSRALARARVDTVKNRARSQTRFGLVKAFLIREGDTNVKPYLNEGHPSPAYHCGRLMAVYARLQYAALGDVGAGVVQRFYAAASATPSLVLGRLARLSQFHLNKLEPGLARYFETKIANIWSRIGDRPPGALKLEEQSLFALGYYQQLAADRAEKAAASEAETVKEEENV